MSAIVLDFLVGASGKKIKFWTIESIVSPRNSLVHNAVRVPLWLSGGAFYLAKTLKGNWPPCPPATYTLEDN